MKRIALAVAVVVMAAGACKKAQNSNADTMRADSMRMADSMKMAPGDTTHMMADTSKAQATPAPKPPPAPARRQTRRP